MGGYPPANGYPVGPAYGAPAAASSTPRRGTLVVVLIAIAVIGVLVALVIGIIPRGLGDRGESVPASDSDDSGQTAPDPGDTEAEPAEPDDAPSLPDTGGSAEATLQNKIDEYKAARTDGSLWERIPDTEFNRTAVSAYLYLMTDMKLAASFGADTSEYLQRAAKLEELLLSEQPLGSDIEIVLSDRTFTYDGDTGEGGYTEN